jgi:hypothetical protein
MYNNCLGREDILILLGLCSGLWCLTLLSTIFQLYREPVLLVEETVEYPEKTTDLSQVTDKLYHLGFELTLVVIGTDIIGSYKSNYHMVMTKYRQVKPYSTCCKGQYLNILGSKSLDRTFYLQYNTSSSCICFNLFSW